MLLLPWSTCLFTDSLCGVYWCKRPRAGAEIASHIQPSPSVHFEETIGQTAFPASPFRPLWARRGFRQWTSSYRRPSFADAMMSRTLRRSFLCCGLDPVCISIFMSDPPPGPSNRGSVSERMNQNFNEVKHVAKTGIVRGLTPLETFRLFKSNFLPFLQ